MLAEIIDIVINNIPFGEYDYNNAWLSFRDYVHLKQTCKEINTLITKYWKLNITELDYDVYLGIGNYGLDYLRYVHNVEHVRRFIEIFGYRYTGECLLYSIPPIYELWVLHMQHGANPHFSYNNASPFDILVFMDPPGAYNILDYILTCYPVNLNTYINMYGMQTIIDALPGRYDLVPLFLKHGFDYNAILPGYGGVVNLCGNHPDIVAEILKYPIDIDILQDDLEDLVGSFIRTGRETIAQSCELITAEIERLEEPSGTVRNHGEI
jgi:hypothetical protein